MNVYQTKRLVVLVSLLTTAIAAHRGLAESPRGWSEFHGPQAAGYAGHGSLPTDWDDSDYAWRRELGSRDVGSPVVNGGKVFLLVSQPDQERIALEAIDLASGDLVWSKDYAHRPHHLHNRNTFASSTPAADKTHVFTAWSEPEHTFLKCFDHAGNEIWSRDFGSWQSQHGFGTSPRLYGSLVLLMNSQQGEQLKPGQRPGESRMIAVDRRTGETVWKTDLETTRSCYGVPAIYDPGGGQRTQVIDANTGNGMFGLDATTGEMLWNTNVFRMRCCSSPLIVGDIAIASSGSGGGGNHLVAVRIPKAGEKPREVYRIERGAAPYVPTPALKDGLMYIISDSGIASCVDARTGERKWTKRIGGNFGASPVIVGDTLLLISLDGTATLLKAGEEFEELNQMDLGAPVGATPAFAEGRLLLRVGDELRCLAPSSA